MSEEEKKAVECLKKQYKQSAEKKDATLTIYLVKVKRILELIEKQQKEISILRYSLYNEREREKDMIHTDRIIEKIEELEEQQEKLKYDGNACFADYEQFCKNLNFLKEQIKELLEEK